MKFNCHFSILFVAGAAFREMRMIAGARNAVFFNTNAHGECDYITSVARRVADGQFRVLGSWSERSRIMVGSSPQCK